MRTPTIVLRVAITKHEWTKIRKAALDANLTAPEYVAQLLRKGMRDVR